VTHIYRSRKTEKLNLLSIEDLEESERPAATDSTATTVETQLILVQLYALIQRLNPAERQIITLYLEGLDAASIGEITGISPGYVATKIHRITQILENRFLNGDNHHNRSRLRCHSRIVAATERLFVLDGA
jgi:RNA polymerase sigma-70 factor, ECF subfamily